MSNFPRTKNEIEQKFSDAQSLSSSFVAQALSSIRGHSAIVTPDWSNFAAHTFFNSAELKTRAALKRIIDEYPIGISGASVGSLSADAVAAVDDFLLRSNGFEKYVLNYLGGVTGNVYMGVQPSITAEARTITTDRLPLVVIQRNTTNALVGSQTSLSANLLSLSQSFDAGLNTIQLVSGTAVDFDVVYFDDGNFFTGRILPSSTIHSVNRQSDMTTWIPEAYSIGDTEENLKKFMSIAGAVFDDIKLYINQLANVNRISYDDFDRYPDGMIPVLLAKHFGFELIDTLLRQDLSKYLRREGDSVPLYQVTYKIWNRVLNNLIYILKRKGTREAIDALIRTYGVPADYLQIDDYSFHSEPTLQRRVDYKNVRMLTFDGSGYLEFEPDVASSFNLSAHQDFTIEARISSQESKKQYVFASFKNPSSGWYLRLKNILPIFGTVNSEADYAFLSSSDRAATADVQAAIYNSYATIFGIRRSDTLEVWTCWVDENSGSATYHSVSSTTPFSSTGSFSNLNTWIGGSGSIENFSGVMQEVKMFKFALHPSDIEEHTRNFESISYMHSGGSLDQIVGEWKLKENTQFAKNIGPGVFRNSGAINAHTLSASVSAYGMGSLYTSTNFHTIIEGVRKETNYTNTGEWTDDNVDVYISNNQKQRKSNILHVGFNPIKAVNTDIVNVFGNLNVSDVKGDPANFYGANSNSYGYPVESISASTVFKRYSSTILQLAGQKIDINTYIDAVENLFPMIEGIMNGVRQLIPARTRLINKGITIEKHLLESSRYAYSTPSVASDQIYSDTITQPHEEKITSHDSKFDTLTFDVSTSGSGQSTFDYFNFSQQQSLEAATNVLQTIGDRTVLPFYQEVYNPGDTSINLSLNRNFLRTATPITDWTTSITGVFHLLRTSNGKIITSQQNCLRLEIPFSASGNPVSATEHWFNVYINNILLDASQTTFDFAMSSKTGLSLLITRRVNFLDRQIGIVNIRVTNLLSGESQQIPIFVSTDETGLGGIIEVQNQITT